MDLFGVIRRGLTVTVAPASWPLRGPYQGVRVSVSGQTWNGMVTRNRSITAAELEAAEDPRELIDRAIRELSENGGW